MELISQSAIRIGKVVWRPGHGGSAVTVVCKATFELRPGVSPFADCQDPIVEADVWTDTGSLLRATDLVPFKKRPEVLLVGHAYAPEGRPAQSLIVRLIVGEIDKSIWVVGDRYVGADGRFDEPAPFKRMPLVWERAAGGPGTENPVGRPFSATMPTLATDRLPAPNLYPPTAEFPRSRIPVPPLGFGPISPLWPSRLACLHKHAAGWDPHRWYERPLPADIDLAYLNAAPVDQQRAMPFGEEALYLENLHPRFARLSTRLESIAPVATVEQGSGSEPLKLRCDTLVIDADRGLAMLVWRGHVLVDHPDRLRRVVVTGPDAPEITIRPPRAGDAYDETATLLPSMQMPAGAALPFTPATTPVIFPALPMESSAKERLDGLDAADVDAWSTQTLALGLLLPATVLPFVGALIEQKPQHLEPPPLQPSVEAPGAASLAAWQQIPPERPEPSTTAAALSPAQEQKPPPPEPDSTEARLRLIQRAIWKGDRPIQQILADHGLTELEWRVTKRAFARRGSE